MATRLAQAEISGPPAYTRKMAWLMPLLDGEPLTVVCGHGERAMTAASLLTRLGHRDLSVATGGRGDWATACGRPLEISR